MLILIIIILVAVGILSFLIFKARQELKKEPKEPEPKLLEEVIKTNEGTFWDKRQI